LVAESDSYGSQVFIHNAAAVGTNVTVHYRGATGSASPGAFTCPIIAVQSGNVVKDLSRRAVPALNPD
jgi:hypothetical protein